ncbi:PREDICTED: protein aubergine-like [Dinoponera quadriceps]|uniref:Protein aubergine-like n=1 Tax=Dinoponera quadriceps TaxID=609295 RepID=A0A6P3XI70_DINQU|nr:PREDICTED: protein aubergine-like [Dinoponera quadriceps]
MSQRDRRDYDPSEPSTSSGYRKTGASSSSRTPYSRSQESTVREGSEYDAGPSSSSTYSEQHGAEPMAVDPAGGDNKSVQHGRRSFLQTTFVTKPSNLVTKKGTSGEQIILQSNYFKLLTLPNWCLYKYRVDYEPEEERTVVRKGLLKLHKEKVGPYIFDGTILYTTARLPEKLELVSARKSDNAHIKISIRLVGDVTQDDPHYIQVFNIIMRKCLEHLKLQLVGRNYYDARNKISIYEYKLELWPGYITSIHQHEYNILMCCEVSHKVMRQQTLLDILADCYRHNSHDFRSEFCRNVIGIIVLTDYNNNTYRIEDVDWNANPSSTFPKKTGENVSYREYYWEKYRINIVDMTQPMLVTRNKPKERNANKGDLVYLVPELCRATGLTDNMRENFYLMKALSTHTRVNPEARIAKLRSFNERLRKEPKVVEELKDWKMTLDTNLVEVPARILPPEKLLFGRNTIINSQLGDWSRNMQRAPLARSKELRNWILIGCDRERQNIEQFVRRLLDVSRGISFRVEHPRIQWIRDDKSSTYTENLEYVLSKFVPDLVFCVVSNNRADRYVAIKKKCCIDRPVPSQVFLQKNLCSRTVMSIATKVAIQMNCKLGGAPWYIENPLKGLMTIGFDICHDAATKGRKFLAMVATVDQSLAQFYSSITLYHNYEELVEQLCMGVSKAVQAYRANNKALPMCLLIYRDGVSDGEVPQVYENEVGNLKKKLEELYYGPNYKMSFIIVSKRINTKLFYRRNNPPVGTVVDDIITSPFKYDFFLVSQVVRQGTISPTSYSVISDNSGLNPEAMQRITYKLTHLYYNCSTTVRVPAPCHYAQKLSFLVGKFLHRPPHSQLENQLFFL